MSVTNNHGIGYYTMACTVLPPVYYVNFQYRKYVILSTWLAIILQRYINGMWIRFDPRIRFDGSEPNQIKCPLVWIGFKSLNPNIISSSLEFKF